jgi:transposase
VERLWPSRSSGEVPKPFTADAAVEVFMLIGALDKKVWIFTGTVDMRKSYDGLYALARAGGFQVFDGDLFLFVSANRKRAKVLFWDGSGMNILMKRMEKHLFSRLVEMKEMSVSELNLFMQGARLQSQIMIPEKQIYDA